MSSNTFVLPTYQALLNSSLGAVVKCLNASDHWNAWVALQSLYYILPGKQRKNLKVEFSTIEGKIAELSNVGLGSDRLVLQVSQNHRLMMILRTYNLPFLGRCIEEMFKAGLLVKKPRDIPIGTVEP